MREGDSGEIAPSPKEGSLEVSLAGMSSSAGAKSTKKEAEREEAQEGATKDDVQEVAQVWGTSPFGGLYAI